MGLKLDCGGRSHTVTIVARRPHLVVTVDGRHHVVTDIGEAGDGSRALVIDGRTTACTRVETTDGALLRTGGHTLPVRRLGSSGDAAGAGSGAHVVRAPMPGIVVAVHKGPGDPVTRGETVVTIESMKLQMKLAAPRDGELAEIGVQAGDGFDKDAVLARLVIPPED
jgi:biotin carboxyl carrier protein